VFFEPSIRGCRERLRTGLYPPALRPERSVGAVDGDGVKRFEAEAGRGDDCSIIPTLLFSWLRIAAEADSRTECGSAARPAPK